MKEEDVTVFCFTSSRIDIPTAPSSPFPPLYLSVRSCLSAGTLTLKLKHTLRGEDSTHRRGPGRWNQRSQPRDPLRPLLVTTVIARMLQVLTRLYPNCRSVSKENENCCFVVGGVHRPHSHNLVMPWQTATLSGPFSFSVKSWIQTL